MFNLVIKAVLMASLFAAAAAGQSRDQNYPTSVEVPEISGAIKARSLGDSRLTSYFYAFDGSQGDVFMNVVTRNFTGDIDVFTRDTMRPLTKVVIVGDAGQQIETGRVIYLRKPERLILRVQGRTPNDDPAAFQIKFAGSFVAVRESPAIEEPTIARETPPARPPVNNVGTAAAEPKPSPEIVERREGRPAATPPPRPARTADARSAGRKEEIPAREPAKTAKAGATPAAKPSSEPVRTLLGRRPAPERQSPPPKAPPAPDPLASINLKIELKAGGEILRPLNEVLRFTVDKGVLTVTMKTGAITRYSMVTEVSRVTIE